MSEVRTEPRLLSEVEAARRCGISRLTLFRARKAGRIGFYRIGRRILFSETHISDFLNVAEVKPGVSA